jgi:transcriptional antiterminator RfaH
MPLLPLKDVVFPADLFATVLDRGAAWWVLHTKPRTEKALGERLLRSGVSFFLPQYAKLLNRGGRRRTSYLPLFPGYLFLRGTPDDRARAMATGLVAGALAVPDQPSLHGQLAQVYRVMSNDVAACRPADDPRVGNLVEITEGPFAGMTGRVTEVSGGYRFVVEVEFIGRGVAVTLAHWMFRRL